jgi:hypothetical protein
MLAVSRGILLTGLLLGGLWVGASQPAQAEVPRVYVTAKAAAPGLDVEALEVLALARAALLEAQGFDWQSADERVRGAHVEARAAQRRALDLLRRGRQAYLKLDLDPAVRQLEQALGEWSKAQAVIDTPEFVAETLMYLGAAHVLGDAHARAAEVFTRYHVQFHAITPNAGLFNPAIMAQWQAAGQALHRRAAGALEIRVRPASAAVSVDGLAYGTGTVNVEGLAPGRHWVRASGLGAEGRTAEVVVESGRVSVVELGELPDSAALLDLFEHAGRSEGARALAQELGVQSLAVIEVQAGEGEGELALTMRGFDGTSGRQEAVFSRAIGPDFVERARSLRGLVAAWLDRTLSSQRARVRPAPVAVGGAAAGGVLDPAPGPQASEARPAWYRRWWVWALVGGATAAGVTAAVLTTRDSGAASPLPDERGSLTLEF